MVRWWWFGPAVEKPEILHELQQMKADGNGRILLFTQRFCGMLLHFNHL